MTPEHARRAFLDRLMERREGRIPAEDFLQETEEILEGFPLYPRDPVLASGWAAAQILDKNPAAAVDISLRLMSSLYREVRGLAAVIASGLARLQPGFWKDAARHLLRDEDWEVRDLAAHIFDSNRCFEGAVEFHPDFVLETVAEWANDSDDLIRHAATQALIGYALQHSEILDRWLGILDPLSDDPAEYVRRGFAATLHIIGRKHPQEIMSYMEAKTEGASEFRQETFALALEGSFGDRNPEAKARILNRFRISLHHSDDGGTKGGREEGMRDEG